MNIDKLRRQYWLHDGQIKSFHLDTQNGRVEIELLVKRIVVGKEKVPCILKIIFSSLIEVSVFNKFPMDGYYLEFSTSYLDNGHEVGLSMNVFDNSSYVYDKPNWVIKSRKVSWEEV